MLIQELFSLERLSFGAGVVGLSLGIYVLGLAVYYRFFHPYKDIPGPFWASITPFWYFRAVRYGLGDRTQWPIHEKYGPVVRVGPNLVSISDPAAIDTIYGAKRTFTKTEFYEGFNPSISHRRDSFSDTDAKHHAMRRRITAPLYTQSNILSHEPNFDRVIALFRKQMIHFCETGEVFEMSIWLRKYTFDIIGELFYGREGGFGFIRDNIDYMDWCRIIEVMPVPLSAMTYIPYGLRTVFMLTQAVSKDVRDGMKGHFTVIDQAKAAANERWEAMKQPGFVKKNDNLQKMMDIVEEKGEKIDWGIPDVATELWQTIWAGSDTTAIALTSIFYHLHKNPKVLDKLLDEIERAFEAGDLSLPIRYTDAIKLRYLGAVIKESMRMHSSLGTGLPRIVPKDGAEILGRFYHEGGEVMMSQMAVAFDRKTFGEDCHTFDPERWLRVDERTAANMERSTLTFGYGPRMCLGRHVTWTEMFKLLPTILREFKFDLMVDEWTVHRQWFQHAGDVRVKVSRRQSQTSASS